MLFMTGCKAIEGGFQMTMVKCAEYTITIWILRDEKLIILFRN